MPPTDDRAPRDAWSGRRLLLLVDALHPRARRSDHPAALACALAERGVEARVESVAAGILTRSGAGDWEPLAAFAPDAVVAYDPFSPAAWLGARLARRRGWPLLLIEPGWTGERRFHERLLDGFGNRLWGRAVRAACGRLAAFDPLGEQRALARGFAAGRVALVPPGVDLAVFRPTASSAVVGRRHLTGRLLLAVGPLEAGRGLELLLAAFARTVGQRPDWSLVLVGEGPLARRLRVAAERLGVGASVHFVEWLPAAELAGLMAASTLFAAPDEGDGASGMQVIRALASGLPVLVADRPRLAHLVRDGVEGRLVPAGDAQAWRETLLAAASAPDARTRWARAARQRALDRHAWPTIAQALLDLLGELAPPTVGDPALAPERRTAS